MVKLIDVFPDGVPSQPEMGGYEPAWRWTFSGADIRKASRSRSNRLEPAAAIPIHPADDESFLLGHRIMVQIRPRGSRSMIETPDVRAQHLLRQSSGLREATQRVHSDGAASFIDLPVVPR